jgi:hypothetical protein
MSPVKYETGKRWLVFSSPAAWKIHASNSAVEERDVAILAILAGPLASSADGLQQSTIGTVDPDPRRAVFGNPDLTIATNEQAANGAERIRIVALEWEQLEGDVEAAAP